MASRTGGTSQFTITTTGGEAAIEIHSVDGRAREVTVDMGRPVFRDDIALRKPGTDAAVAPATANSMTSGPAPSAAAKAGVREEAPGVGPRAAALAVRDGRRAALGIDAFLQARQVSR